MAALSSEGGELTKVLYEFPLLVGEGHEHMATTRGDLRAAAEALRIPVRLAPTLVAAIAPRKVNIVYND